MSFSPGTAVRVQWNDGNKYDALVVDHQGGHVLIGWPSGQQQWIEQQYIEAAGGGGAPMQIGSLEVAPGASLEVEGGIVVYESAQDYWNELQQIIMQVESQQISLGGVDISRPETLWEKVIGCNPLELQGYNSDQAAQQQGFQDGDHMRLIMQYVEAKWSYMGQDDSGQPAVLTYPDYQNAQAKGAMASMDNERNAAAAADPGLLAPVNGVSVDLWAKAAVMMATQPEGTTPDQLAHKLAELGLDRATYEAAQAGWIAKMQGDTTGVISMKYAEAFAGAQNMSLGGAGGDEAPCTFEHYVELGAAMDAWSEQGLDVNAKLKEVFNIDAMAFSKYGMYWGVKMSTDMSLLTRQGELHALLREKYAGQRFDDDLSF